MARTYRDRAWATGSTRRSVQDAALRYRALHQQEGDHGHCGCAECNPREVFGKTRQERIADIRYREQLEEAGLA